MAMKRNQQRAMFAKLSLIRKARNINEQNIKIVTAPFKEGTVKFKVFKVLTRPVPDKFEARIRLNKLEMKVKSGKLTTNDKSDLNNLKRALN